MDDVFKIENVVREDKGVSFDIVGPIEDLAKFVQQEIAPNLGKRWRGVSRIDDVIRVSRDYSMFRVIDKNDNGEDIKRFSDEVLCCYLDKVVNKMYDLCQLRATDGIRPQHTNE